MQPGYKLRRGPACVRMYVRTYVQDDAAEMRAGEIDVFIVSVMRRD